MSIVSSELHSTFWATVDFLLAFVGLVIVCYPAISAGNSLLGSALNHMTVQLLVSALAFGGTYLFFVNSHWLVTLGEYAFAFMVSLFVVGLIGGMSTVASSNSGILDYPVGRALLIGCAYVLAALLVYHFGHGKVPYSTS